MRLFDSLLSKCNSANEPVMLQLIKTFCLPLLTYCIGALELKKSAITVLSVCWNDAFRRIFKLDKSESVNDLMHICNELDFVGIYKSARINFLKKLQWKCPVLGSLQESVEAQFKTIKQLLYSDNEDLFV